MTRLINVQLVLTVWLQSNDSSLYLIIGPRLGGMSEIKR